MKRLRHGIWAIWATAVACGGSGEGEGGDTEDPASATTSEGLGSESGGSGPDTWAATGGASDPDTSGDGSESESTDESGTDTADPPAACPHPLYAGLDLCELPGPGGGDSCGPYEVPTLPSTTRAITIDSTGTQAALDALEACGTPGTAVEIPNGAGRIGALTLGGVEDCDITLGHDVVVDFLVFGQLPGPMRAPSHRVRVRGGHIGSVWSAPDSSDIVLDGVTIDNGVIPTSERNNSGIVLHSDGPGSVVDRFAVVNSIVRAVEGEPDEQGATDGIGYLGARSQNILFANNNIVTAGNHNSWGFRVGGGCNVLLVDNSVRVSFHKLVRFNDADTDYVYIRGGTWMREFTVDPFGNPNNDAFKELGGDWRTDHVYIHDLSVYLLAPEPVAFGASANTGNADSTWETRGIAWHALDETVVSDAYLTEHEGYCTPGASCDYGVGTNSYGYDPALSFPADPWRQLPTLPISDPDDLPIQP